MISCASRRLAANLAPLAATNRVNTLRIRATERTPVGTPPARYIAAELRTAPRNVAFIDNALKIKDRCAKRGWRRYWRDAGRGAPSQLRTRNA
eukprot:5698823-Prymnesium_polylepis.2